MKLLLLTFYFRPDLSAGSFRMKALVEALLNLRNDIEIEVVTTLPNRYGSFSDAALVEENQPRLTIRRIALPHHQNGVVDQVKAFFFFAFAALRITRGRRHDLVVVTSSRLMTAVLGAEIARRQRTPLYIDIRDIFVDTINDVMPRSAWIANSLFGPLERWVISRATAVNLVSRGFASYFESRYPDRQFSYYTNGVDSAFLTPIEPVQKHYTKRKITILYAGNIGEGQGLEKILPRLAKALDKRANFIVIGDGGRCANLRAALKALGVENVSVQPPVPREQLRQKYSEADVLFLHLNSYPAFRKVLPSKLFEYAATGLPILAGMAGYPASFAKMEIENCVVFEPCNHMSAIKALNNLTLTVADRTVFVNSFNRERIMAKLAADIIKVAKKDKT